MKATIKKASWLLGIGLVCLGMVLVWYSHSLQIKHVELKQYQFQPDKEISSQLQIAVSSRSTELPFIPDSVRRFFRIHTELCLLNPDHTPLVNDDNWLSCFPDKDGLASRQRSHAGETSTFNIPFATKQNNFNGEQHFLKQLRQQKGVWLKLKLVGYWGPPTIESTPFFLDLSAYKSYFEKPTN